MLWVQSWPQWSQLHHGIRSFDLGSSAGRMHPALGLHRATGASPGGGSRLGMAGEGELDPAERRARAYDVRKSERLHLEQPSMQSSKAVALEALSHLQLQGVVPWEEQVTNKLCLHSLLSLSRAFPLGGSSGWGPPPAGTPPSHSLSQELTSGRWQRDHLIQPCDSPWLPPPSLAPAMLLGDLSHPK